jgi:hypothetical protein
VTLAPPIVRSDRHRLREGGDDDQTTIGALVAETLAGLQEGATRA